MNVSPCGRQTAEDFEMKHLGTTVAQASTASTMRSASEDLGVGKINSSTVDMLSTETLAS